MQTNSWKAFSEAMLYTNAFRLSLILFETQPDFPKYQNHLVLMLLFYLFVVFPLKGFNTFPKEEIGFFFQPLQTQIRKRGSNEKGGQTE